MDAPRGPGTADEAFWRDYLLRGDARERRIRRFLNRIPDNPRCKICAAPFGGLGRPLMRIIGKRPSNQNPSMCNACFDFLARHHGGAEIECSFLFVDVRGSTTVAERMSATQFRGLLDRFYATASSVVFAHEGSVDKFVGDEVVAMFFPLMSGDGHAGNAVAAGRDLLVAMGHAQPGGPWLPVGGGVHTGPAWVGAVGDGSHVELTALGDTVNTAARLASAAGPGELLVSRAAAAAAGVDAALERRTLQLKGKELPFETLVLRADDGVSADRAPT